MTKPVHKYGDKCKTVFSWSKNMNNLKDVTIRGTFSIAFRNANNYNNNTSMKTLMDVAREWYQIND